MALLNLFDPRTGTPLTVLDAGGITDMCTGAFTALGAKRLAPKKSRVLGYIGASGTAYLNVRLLDHLFDFDEIRMHSRRPESREAFAEKLRDDLRKNIIVTDNWRDCLEGTDIQVEASRLSEPTSLFKSAEELKSSLVVSYSKMSALILDFTDLFDKLVIDDLEQLGSGSLSALRPSINAGKISANSFYAEIGEIAADLKPRRESDEETILF
jgi:alanine dehydrogenase